jgi:protein-disulfide isomerase
MRNAFRILASAAVLAALTCLPAAADTDPVKDALEKDAQAAAIAKVTELLRDANAPVIGDPNAAVTIVEFFDYQCSFCKAAEPRIEALLKENKNVKLVLKEFPILTPESRVATKAALAAVKQGKYAAFHQAMMLHKGQLKIENVWDYAAQVGLDVARLKKDMDSPEIADQIISNFNLARALKISVVPGFFVETKLLSGVSNKTSTSKIDFNQEVAEAQMAKTK